MREGDQDESGAENRLSPEVQEIRFIHNNWTVVIWIITLAFSIGGFVVAMHGQAATFSQHKELQDKTEVVFKSKDSELDERVRKVEVAIGTLPSINQSLRDMRDDIRTLVETKALPRLRQN